MSPRREVDKGVRIVVNSELHSGGPTFKSVSAALDYIRHMLKNGQGCSVHFEEGGRWQ